jgi:hypothetical protein
MVCDQAQCEQEHSPEPHFLWPVLRDRAVTAT